jgi:NADPH2:quinone reductase
MMAMIHEGLIGPCVYEHVYKGLSTLPNAFNDLAARKIWGKAVVTIGEDQSKGLL